MLVIAIKWRIKEFPEIDSTNTYLKEHSEKYDHLTVIRADYQHRGRGQFERTWESERGKNLLFSILFKEEFPFPTAWMNPITIATLLAVLKDYGIQARFIEPNDIYVTDKKIAGILMETKYEENRLQSFILGVGLNVNQASFPSIIPATSMSLVTNQTYDIRELLNRFLQHLENFLNVGQLIYTYDLPST